MNLEKKQQAKNLFFQTELTKSQIATMLNISRRSLGYWIKDGDWDRLKKSATHLPSILAEKCYHIMGHLTDHHLSECRITNPISHKEIDGLHKLATTIGKLKNRATLNESMEMFGYFMEGLKRRNPKLAAELMPYIDEYISSRASVYTAHVMPDRFSGAAGRIPWIEEDTTEQQIDQREAFYSDPDIIEAYTAAGMALPSEEEISTLSLQTEMPLHDSIVEDHHAERRRILQEQNLQRETRKAEQSISNPIPHIEESFDQENQGSDHAYVTSPSLRSACKGTSVAPGVRLSPIEESFDQANQGSDNLSSDNLTTSPIIESFDQANQGSDDIATFRQDMAGIRQKLHDNPELTTSLSIKNHDKLHFENIDGQNCRLHHGRGVTDFPQAV